MFTFRPRILCLGLAMWTLQSRADDLYYLAVKNTRCSLSEFSKAEKTFKKISRNLTSLHGKTLIGRKYAGDERMTVFWVENEDSKRLYATQSRCLNLGKVFETSVPLSNSDKQIQASSAIPSHTGRQYYFVRAFSWQETITLTRTSDADEFPLLLTSMGVSLGYGRHVYEKGRYEILWDTSLDYGRFEQGFKTYDATEPDMGTKKPTLFGAATGLALLRHFSTDFALGLALPLGFRYVKFAEFPSGYTTQSKTSYFVSALVQSQLALGEWTFIQKAGMIKSWPNYFLSVELAHKF